MADKVVVCNTYAANRRPNAVVEWLRNLRVLVAIISEVGRSESPLRRAGLLYVSPKDKPPDVAIWVRRRRWKRRGLAIYRRVSPFIDRPQSDKKMLWRDRHIVRFRFFKRVWYAVHANAAIGNDEGEYFNNKGARAWKQAMSTLEGMILHDLRKGYRPRVGGDFNIRPNSGELLNPAHMFKSLGMEFINVDVMYLAWHPGRDRCVRSGIGPRVPGADAHRSLHAVFRRPKRTRRRR